MSLFNNHIAHKFKLTGVCFLLFFFLYGINVTFLPLYTSQIIALGILVSFIIYSIEFPDYFIKTDKSTQLVFSIWVLLFLWVFILSVATVFKDIGLLVNTSLLFLQVFIGSLFFALWFYRKKYTFRDVMRILQVLIVIQGVFIIIYFFSMDFKLLTLKFIPEGGNLPALHPYRSRGLTHGAGATLAAFQGTGLLITAYLIVKAKSWKMTLFDIAALGVLAGSVMLTGRTGFIIVPFIIGFVVIHVIYQSRMSRKLLTSSLIFPAIILGGFILMETVYMKYFGAGSDAFSDLTRWAFGELGDLLTSGESRTVNVLFQEHLFFPKEPLLLLLGDPTTYSVNRIPSDLGLVRRIFGTGLIGLTLVYSLVGFISYYSMKKAPGMSEKLFILVFTVWMFLLELKEPFVTDFRFASVYLIIFCFICVAPLQKLNVVKLKKGSSVTDETKS